MSTQTPLKPTSKYLSPCRTFGLKRKSTTKTPSGLLLTPCSDVHSTEQPIKKNRPCNEQNTLNSICTTPLSANSSLKVIKRVKVLESIENTPKGNIKRAKLSKTCETDLSNENSTGSNNNEVDKDNLPFEGFVSKDDLVALISKINKKIAQVNSLKRNEVYSKKHDVEKLCILTKKWKEAFKEVVYAIQGELKLKGQEVALHVILQEHKIPFEAVGFREDVMDFE